MAASGLLTAGLGIGKAIMKKNLAKDQMARSQDLRNQGLAVKKPALRPEFQRALQGSKLRTLTGLPNEQMIKDEVDLENATSFGRGQGVASSGGELLQYAASLNAQGNQLKRGISTESANMRNQNYGNYLNTLWNVGGEELKNVAIQRMERDKFLDQSSALENAATANKFQGKQEILGAIGEGIGGAMGSIGGAMSGKAGAEADVSGMTQNSTDGTRFDYNKSGLQFQHLQQQGVQGGVITVMSPDGKALRIPITQLNNYMKMGYTRV